MKNLTKTIFAVMLAVLASISLVACGSMTPNDENESGENSVAEKIELASATLGEVEFTNADTVTISQESNVYTISGTIDAMSDSQKTAFGVEDVTHVVALKFTFDKERTLSSFEISGSTTKVYSSDTSAQNYAGSLSELLDSEEGEDAYTLLVLSANTQSYSLKTTYTDESTSTIEVRIVATLATATSE